VDGEPWSPYTLSTSLERSDWESGAHTIRVRARDSDFNVDEIPAVHAFEIILPIWRQTWAQVLIGFIVLLIFGLITLVVRQRLAHLLELERIKLHFFTNISHELRTPLTLILGPVEKLLIEEKKDSRHQSYLRTIQTNTSRLLYLIDQLLDYRRVDQGKLVHEPRRLDLVALIRNVMDTFDFVVNEKNQTLHLSTPFKSCHLELDEDIYYKVINNLIHNAIKYTPPDGYIEIKLGLSERISAEGQVYELVLQVEDNGRGISQELIRNIFEPFYQGSQKAGKMKQGVGIGLALVKELVEFTHGSIWVNSPVPGRSSGTRFTVTLPAKTAEIEYEPGMEVASRATEVPSPALLEAEEEAKPLKPAHIHLVEDNPDVLQFLQSELSEDYEVSVSVDGLAAEDFVLENVPDLVITDVMMPRQDGFDLCKHLKTNPVSSHVPVIMLTAFKTQHHEEEGLSYGADDYISKPVSMRVLKLKIANLLTQRERLREQIRLEYGLMPSKSEIRNVDKQFLDNAERVAVEFLGDEFFGVEQFAQEMGMSRSNFYKKFRDLTGMSPANYMKVKRLNEASRRILAGEGNITEIAFDVGFSDVSYFSRCFKEHFGCPPSKYAGRETAGKQAG
jgi:signal transduction histidine kinase/DNA-binding response OmpR family regulator